MTIYPKKVPLKTSVLAAQFTSVRVFGTASASHVGVISESNRHPSIPFAFLFHESQLI